MWTYVPPTSFKVTPQPDNEEIASQFIGLFGVTVVCILFGIKTYNIQYKFLSYSKWLIILLYICSWAFTVSGLTLMLTNNGNFTSCLLSEYACDVFYSGTKICIYCWLIEKVWIVNAGRTSRWDTLSYRFHILLLTPYVGIFALMIYFHNAWLLADGTCIIGLQVYASVPLLVYDFIINLYMTILFVRPIMKIDKVTNADQKTSRLRDVARRTMVASVVCLIASFANVCALAILQGQERGVVCLTCCMFDVAINVITIHWVTSQPNGKAIRDVTPDTDFSGDYNYNVKEGSAFSSNPSQNTSSDQSNHHEKKKNKRKTNSIPISEQYGEFGNHHGDGLDLTSNYLPTHYMSATNNQIITSPAVTYQQSIPSNDTINYQSFQISSLNNNNNHSHHDHGHGQIHSSPIPYYSNGKYVMMTDDEDNNSNSRCPSVHESHSSKQSLTRVISN